MKFKKFKTGALADKQLIDLAHQGYLTNVKKENVKPSSIDLVLSDEAYEIKRVFLPQKGEMVRQVLSLAGAKSIDLKNNLLRNHLYLIRLAEKASLPTGIFGYVNPKSTTGRNDVHARLLADGIPRYDLIHGLDEKELWVVVEPRSYDIILEPGLSLIQLRLFNGEVWLNEKKLKSFYQKQKLLWTLDGKSLDYGDIKVRDNDGSIILTVDMESSLIGFASNKIFPRPVSLSKVNHYCSKGFFKPILRDNSGFLRLKKGCFYLLSTAEALRLPPDLACEMLPMDEKSGEFRSHYAGFIDPGWGYGRKGEGCGRPLTLEIRPFENILIRPGQPLAKIRFNTMSELPTKCYDAISSNYTIQDGVRLAKQFINICEG